MFSGKANPMCFATTILSLAIILMITMIQDCDGYLAACNDSTVAECQVFVEEEEEFMMDTEEHRLILATNNGDGTHKTVDGASDKNHPYCDGNCKDDGPYNVGGKQCPKYPCGIISVLATNNGVGTHRSDAAFESGNPACTPNCAGGRFTGSGCTVWNRCQH